MSAVEFGELPDRSGRPYTVRTGKWAAIAAELRARPGEWAKVSTSTSNGTAYQIASQLRLGKYRPFQPAGQFEAVKRGFDVWARFVGEPS